MHLSPAGVATAVAQIGFCGEAAAPALQCVRIADKVSPPTAGEKLFSGSSARCFAWSDPAMLFNGVGLQRRLHQPSSPHCCWSCSGCSAGWSGCLLRFQAAFGSRHAGRQIRQRAGIGLAADILSKLRHI